MMVNLQKQKSETEAIQTERKSAEEEHLNKLKFFASLEAKTNEMYGQKSDKQETLDKLLLLKDASRK